MGRICIYLTYDKNKIVDKYIGYMLGELRKCADYMAVVCNETEIIRGEDLLEAHADKVFYRENIGFDAGGFKEALCNYVGWKKVLEYDELVLVNDSIFGPFEKMEKIFSDMDGKEADFWGLTRMGPSQELGECIPEHIQTFFCVIRTSMLHSAAFREYWEGLPYYTTFDAVVKNHEIRFTPYFAQLGYKYAVLADMEANDSSNIANNYLQYATICCELIKKRGFPFLKRQQITYDMQNLQTQENIRQAIDYIQENTDYDIDMIWQNIIRTMNVSDLYRNLHLRYIIDSASGKRNSAKAAIAVVACNRGAQEYITDYLDRLEETCDIYIFSPDRYILAEYEGRQYIKRKRLSDAEQWFQEVTRGLFQYEYVCIVHDEDMTSEVRPSCTGKSYFYSIWENLIKNQNYVEKIIELFEREKYLGLLASPQVFFSRYFGELGRRWSGKYDRIADLTQKMGLDCEISYDKCPFAAPHNFWIRGEILQKLCNGMVQPDMECLPYMWIYIAQDSGFYSGIVESSAYAGMNEVNMWECLEHVTMDVRKHFGEFEDSMDFRRVMFSNVLENFCNRYKDIYIYGAGYMAKQYQKMIPMAKAFIVSDGQEKGELLNGLKILYLSEITPTNDIGIVVCLNERNQHQVIPVLESRGLRHYLCI